MQSNMAADNKKHKKSDQPRILAMVESRARTPMKDDETQFVTRQKFLKQTNFRSSMEPEVITDSEMRRSSARRQPEEDDPSKVEQFTYQSLRHMIESKPKAKPLQSKRGNSVKKT